MQYVFMDNFRGFSRTLLPLRQVTFLVGENSTGKSSFLKLLNVLSRPRFWFDPAFSFQEDTEFESFGDIVSAWAHDKTFFTVGILLLQPKKKPTSVSCSFALCRFSDRDGVPSLSRYVQFRGGRLTKLIFQRKSTKFKTASHEDSFPNDGEARRFFHELLESDATDTSGFRLLPKNVPPGQPLPLVLGIAHSIDKGETISMGSFSAEIPFSLNLTWIAPIRTKPQRFYGGGQKSFSPEGAHTPFLLRRALRTRSKSLGFAAGLRAFGEASGLFDTVLPHSFSKSPHSPFEILIRFTGAELNINNVGYGVSQVLPLVVEFLSKREGHAFAVQQPEVHLHPRAQAALGDLVAERARERKQKFILETHSDYLIDRCRLNINKAHDALDSQVIFFKRTDGGNEASALVIGPDGKYPDLQPPEFRRFFVKEEMDLLEI